MQQTSNVPSGQVQAGSITVMPKFMYGVKSSVRNNVHFLGDHHVIYPCGHNMVIYCLDDKSQIFIPGIEGSEGITTLALSPSKRFLAVCEKSEHALCIIYDLYGVTTTKGGVQ